MMTVAGIDLGSGSAKAVLLREDGVVPARAEIRTRADFEAVARELLERVRSEAGLPPAGIDYVATTGLGRYSVSFRDIQVTDVTAAARGARHLVPDATHVLDVGAQSTRAIRLREGGKVKDFRSNERCAAGGGAFLVRAARYLEIPLESMGRLSLESNAPKPISSVCAVLAESEIINHVSENVAICDIVRGLHESMAERAFGQLKRVGLAGKVVFVGGVALQEGMVEACRRKFAIPVVVPEHPQYATALGAAVLGLQRARKRISQTAGQAPSPSA